MSDIVERFECGYGGMEFDRAGDYVRVEDYDALRAERDAALAERDKAHAKCATAERFRMEDGFSHINEAASFARDRQTLRAALAEAHRVLRLVMYDTPCTSSSCHRCVATRAAIAAVLAQEGR